MKTARILFIIAAVWASSMILGRRATAQPTGSVGDKGVLGQFEQLVLSLTKRGESNTVAEVSKLVSAMNAGRDAVEAVVTIRVLESLHSGDTNAAIRLLETRLDGTVMTLGAGIADQRDPKHDKILKLAKDYRGKHPHNSGDPETDAAVARAFESLSKR